MSVNQSARLGGIIGIFFRFSFNMKVSYVFSLESPHRGDPNKYTQHAFIEAILMSTQNIPFSILKREIEIILNLQLWDFS